MKLNVFIPGNNILDIIPFFETYDFTCTGIEICNYVVQCNRMCETASTTRVDRITICSKCTARTYNKCTRMSFKDVFGFVVFVSCRG